MTHDDFTRFLDQISRCFVTGDFVPWRDRVLLPFSIITREGVEELADEAALRRNFDLYLDACRILALDDVVREPLALEDCGDGVWIGTYRTHLMSGAIRAVDPYVSSAMLHPGPDGLRMSSILNGRGHSEWTGVLPGQAVPAMDGLRGVR